MTYVLCWGNCLDTKLFTGPDLPLAYQWRLWNFHANLQQFWSAYLLFPRPPWPWPLWTCVKTAWGRQFWIMRGWLSSELAATRKLGASFPSSIGRGSEDSCGTRRGRGPGRTPPLSGLARRRASPGHPGLRWAAFAWSYSVCSGTIFSPGSRWAWGSWPGEPFQGLTGTSGGWTSSLTRRPECGRRQRGSASAAAWELGASSGRWLKCFHNPTGKSPSAYLETRGARRAGKEKVTW